MANAPDITMLTQLPEKFAYLFEDMEQEMTSICEVDSVIAKLRSDNERYERRILDVDEQEKKATIETFNLQTQIAELEAKLDGLDREKRLMEGNVRSARSNKAYLRRLIRARTMKIAAREKQLLLYEAKKRLQTIGRTLKHNVGTRRRGTGGFDIVAVEDFPPNETETKSEGHILRPPDGQ
jgi:chromosome segregation ATPase